MKYKWCLLTHWVPMANILFTVAKICNSQFKCEYLKNERLFFNFSSQFWNLNQILNIFRKKMMVLAKVFPKLQTMKNLVTPLSKKGCLRIRLHSRQGKVSGLVAKSPWECLYHVFSSFWKRLIRKISRLV